MFNKKEYMKEYHKLHKEEIMRRHRKYYKSHREELKEHSKKYNKEHKEDKKEYNKEYRELHREEIKKYKKEYDKKYRELHREEIKKYRELHREETKKYNEKHNKKHKNILRALSLEIKSKGCIRCGYKDNMRKLLFHHVDPSTKKYNIANLWSRTIKQHKEELDKCVVLCFKCHAAVHKEMEKP